MKLEVGMYVRYKNGIGKIVAKYVKGVLLDKGKGGYFRTENIDIFKASHNIIDLIEVGDYVNGYKVVKIGDLGCYDNRIGSKYIEIDFNVENDYEHWCEDTALQNPDIKSIVTKEQFEQMQYKVDN